MSQKKRLREKKRMRPLFQIEFREIKKKSKEKKKERTLEIKRIGLLVCNYEALCMLLSE